MEVRAQSPLWMLMTFFYLNDKTRLCFFLSFSVTRSYQFTLAKKVPGSESGELGGLKLLKRPLSDLGADDGRRHRGGGDVLYLTTFLRARASSASATCLSVKRMKMQLSASQVSVATRNVSILFRFR